MLEYTTKHSPVTWPTFLPPLLRKGAYLCIGILIGFFGARWYLTQLATSPSTRGREQRLGLHEFVNPLLDCEVVNKLNVKEFKPLEADINKTIDDEVSQKRADHISVYFRGLNSGRWVGINEDDQYIGASLIKLPVAFTYYKFAESDPATFQKTLTDDVDPSTVTPQNIAPSKTITAGQTYSVQDLLQYMLINSDNAAMTLLVKNVKQADIDNIFTDVGIQRNLDANNNISISPKAYSTFFRLLYNATFFSQDASEELLKTLSQSEYKDGLVAGVPAGIPVAHKFGERTETDSSGNITLAELHDCGIIYLPQHPFVLCVMTRGQNMTDLATAIQHVTKTAYESFDAYLKKNGG